MPKSFSIIFPCYNESGSILDLVKVLKNFPKKYSVEFILVENGSTDNSKEIFETKIKTTDCIKKVYVKNNQGYGYGIIQGLKKSTGKYVGWLHADLQYNPLELIKFFEYILDHPAEKIFLKGERHNRPLVDHIFTYGMGMANTLIFKKPMSNVMAVPVLFNRELIINLDRWPKDFTIDIYAYVLATQKNFLIKHLPVHLKERTAGKSSWNTGLKSRIKQSHKMLKGSLEVKNKIKKGEQ